MIPSRLTPRRKRVLRQATRWIALLGGVALAWPWRWGSTGSVLLPALSPFIATASGISVRTVGILAGLAIPVVVLAGVVPRWFCRHACPTGLLLDGAQRLRSPAPRRGKGWPPVGRWLLLLTLGGACVGYPLFLWLDPLAIFNGFLNAWRRPLAVGALLGGLGLPLLLALEIAAPALWCRRLCPLGATQDFLFAGRRFLRRPRRGGKGRDVREASPNLGRRWFLAGASAAMGAFAARVARGGDRTALLRPPGALGQGRFTGVCVRCGNCAQVCPAKIIKPDVGPGGLAGLLAPRLRFDRDYCRADCCLCGRVCPSGAIARLPLPAKRRQVIGLAVVNLDSCLLAQGRECTACLRKCPFEALEMVSSDGGFSNEPRVIAVRCTGCGACEVVCPAEPLRAITVQPSARALLLEDPPFPRNDLARPLSRTAG
ncbi:MAG: 4Fe-4S binding protein [Verrucomicrobiales bacterium]|nr:4Fe-4S binding protein [Verrucomicrobiales bacterium]